MMHGVLRCFKNQFKSATGPDFLYGRRWWYICLVLIVTTASAGLLTYCSSGSGGFADVVSALTLPSRITMTNIDDAGTSKAQPSDRFAGSASNGPKLYSEPGTDYSLEPKDVWVDDTDVLDMVNDILGVVQDSGYENFINAGPYKALVREVGDAKQSQGGSSTTSSTTESLMEIVLEISRENNSSPMIIKVWVKEEDGPGDNPMLIRGYFEVSAGVSIQYPYGQLEAHFQGTKLDDQGQEMPGDPLFEMAMSVGADNDGNVIVQFVESGEEVEGAQTFEWDNRARIVANTSLTEGNAYVYTLETDGGTGLPVEETDYIAFNIDYFKEQEEGDPTVYVYDKNDLIHKVYRYKLFDAETGDKVTLNSGFPIRLADGQYAHVGYYGLWAPHGTTVSHGDTVTHAETGEAYTLFKVGGKLTKHTRAQTQLVDLTDVEISVWNNASQKDFIVIWDGIGNFKKIGERNHMTGQIDYYAEPWDDYFFTNEWDGGWCEALKAFLPLGNLTPMNADTVYYHAEETINPASAGDMTLFFWGFALEAPITQTVIDNAPADEVTYWSGPAVGKTYNFDRLTLVLADIDGDDVILDSELNLDGTNYEWGYQMGPLTTDDSYKSDNWWQIHESETYYNWATGPGEWNQFTTVKDSGENLISFQPPLRLAYTHQTEYDLNDDDTHDGKKFSIDYDGFELHIPWGFNDDEEEWEPIFNLNDGTVLIAANGSGDQYVVKGVEEGLVMAEVTGPDPDPSLTIDQTIAPPDLTYDQAKTDLVGAVPADAVLKVIKGEVLE